MEKGIINIYKEYLRVIMEDFKKYKMLGNKTFSQLYENDFHFKSDEESNSIAIIIQHLSGNMFSRFTDFLTTDGEKPTRYRDLEFKEQNLSKEELIKKWNNGQDVLFAVLNNLKEEDLKSMLRLEMNGIL